MPELTAVLLPQPPKYQGYRHVPPCPALYRYLGTRTVLENPIIWASALVTEENDWSGQDRARPMEGKTSDLAQRPRKLIQTLQEICYLGKPRSQSSPHRDPNSLRLMTRALSANPEAAKDPTETGGFSLPLKQNMPGTKGYKNRTEFIPQAAERLQRHWDPRASRHRSHSL